ncbi:MAG: hypothetical protein WC044_03250 [Crocinitomicaceae bacterium]
MKSSNTIRIAGFVCFALSLSNVYAQRTPIQFFRPNDQTGLNIYETSKNDSVKYDGFKIRVGGDFAMQFQSINQSNTLGNLVNLGSNFNLPSANFNIDAQLYSGVRLHMKTYLSAKHHNEAWIKGGHIQIDKLDFIKQGFLDGVMKYTTLTIGMDEFNYGDAHFRRSDNARTIFNPFIGNYIMDAFSTEAFADVTVQAKGFIFVAGVTNGKLNQDVVVTGTSDNKPSFFGKLGYDKQLSDDFRVRLTGSIYDNQGKTTGTWLYGGDRAGGRYYNIMKTVPDSTGAVQGSDFEGRYNARFTKLTAVQFNPFIKFKGLEFFGIYEVAMGNATLSPTSKEGSFTQIAAELVYRFGKEEKFFVGGRYNSVTGNTTTASKTLTLNRLNIGAGWFLTQNILVKAEYVNQEYVGDGWTGRYAGAQFNGFNLEASISF